MKEEFQAYKFTPRILQRIALCNTILDDLAAQGYSVSLRQLYYQLVSKGDIPNTQKDYKQLGDTLSKARLAGLVDWRSLEDRGRTLRGTDGSESDPASFFSGMDTQYFIPWWDGQENYVEVWVEKDALINVVERAANRHRVRYFSCRGYSSQSEQYRAGKRFAGHRSAGRHVHVIHLGDHDPSGLDMTRDNRERLSMFAEYDVTVHRVALNMDQIDELNPPPNPAKVTDSRAKEYIAQFGRKSWELDALPPAYLDRLIDRNIRELIDTDLMDQRKEQERQEQQEVARMAAVIGDNYSDVQRLFSDHGWL